MGGIIKMFNRFAQRRLCRGSSTADRPWRGRPTRWLFGRLLKQVSLNHVDIEDE